MVNGPFDIWVERQGRLFQTTVRFIDDSHLRRIINKMVAQVGRRIDESSPMVDARLPDGSRVNAIIAWAADRLTRRPVENEEIINLAERLGVKLATVTGDYDLGTPSGRLHFRQLGIIARYESEHRAERLRLKFNEQALADTFAQVLALCAIGVVWFRLRASQRRWRLLPAGDFARLKWFLPNVSFQAGEGIFRSPTEGPGSHPTAHLHTQWTGGGDPVDDPALAEIITASGPMPADLAVSQQLDDRRLECHQGVDLPGFAGGQMEPDQP